MQTQSPETDAEPVQGDPSPLRSSGRLPGELGYNFIHYGLTSLFGYQIARHITYRNRNRIDRLFIATFLMVLPLLSQSDSASKDTVRFESISLTNTSLSVHRSGMIMKDCSKELKT